MSAIFCAAAWTMPSTTVGGQPQDEGEQDPADDRADDAEQQPPDDGAHDPAASQQYQGIDTSTSGSSTVKLTSSWPFWISMRIFAPTVPVAS